MSKKPTFLNYIAPLVMISIGAGHFIRHGVDAVSIIPVVLGVFALYLALFNHHLLQRVLTGLTKIWYPIAELITIILFTLTFFLVFAPVGLVLRLFKKDVLNKEFNTTPVSYWVDRPDEEKKDYTQQF